MDRFRLARTEQISKRDVLVREFLKSVVAKDERPIFISDRATLLDIWGADEVEMIVRCERHYGVRLSEGELRLPFWQLLDLLDERRAIPPTS
jgi:hypothetical protein